MPQPEMLARISLLLVAILITMGVVLVARSRSRGKRRSGHARSRKNAGAQSIQEGADAKSSGGETPFHDPTIELMTLAVYRRAFGVMHFNYSVLGEHLAVAERVRRTLPQAAERREFFPRKPMVVPKLLAAMRNSDSSLNELVDIIVQDPVLAGDVLRLANSPLYRISREPVESISRAVVLLGIDGLRSLIASSVLHPVFQVPRGYFEDFSATVWRQAQRAAVAAQVHAREARDIDSFSAHLLALLFHMSHIVLFRMTVDSYVKAAGSLPRAEVFTRLLDECAEQLAAHIAEEWDLSDSMIEALDEHIHRLPVDSMGPLGRALYFGRVCGLAAIALESGAVSEEDVLHLLERKGLDETRARELWKVVSASEAPEE